MSAIHLPSGENSGPNSAAAVATSGSGRRSPSSAVVQMSDAPLIEVLVLGENPGDRHRAGKLRVRGIRAPPAPLRRRPSAARMTRNGRRPEVSAVQMTRAPSCAQIAPKSSRSSSVSLTPAPPPRVGDVDLVIPCRRQPWNSRRAPLGEMRGCPGDAPAIPAAGHAGAGAIHPHGDALDRAKTSLQKEQGSVGGDRVVRTARGWIHRQPLGERCRGAGRLSTRQIEGHHRQCACADEQQMPGRGILPEGRPFEDDAPRAGRHGQQGDVGGVRVLGRAATDGEEDFRAAGKQLRPGCALSPAASSRFVAGCDCPSADTRTNP